MREPPLHEAAATGKVDLCLRLIAEGVDLNAINEVSFTPLHVAIKFNQPKVADVLVCAGASMTRISAGGDAPLHLCAAYDRRDIAEMLISHGADLDPLNIFVQNDTPLHIAARLSHTQFCALLLRQGANLEMINSLSRTALGEAAYGGHAQTCAMLIEHGANMHGHAKLASPFLLGLDTDDEKAAKELAKLFIQQGANLKEQDDFGMRRLRKWPALRVLHICTLLDRPNLIETFVRAGMNVNDSMSDWSLSSTIHDGVTPLHLAAFEGKLKAAAKLMELGAIADQSVRACAQENGHQDVLALFDANDARNIMRNIISRSANTNGVRT